jgi:Putative zinc-finger
MSIPEELLMAYADGELSKEERMRVEAAMAADPELARRVERHKALRGRLSAAFGARRHEQEQVPEQLIAAVRSFSGARRGSATVTDLASVRAARAARVAAEAARMRRPWGWREWSGIAASLVLGVVVGHFVLTSPDDSLVGVAGGGLIAEPSLLQALSTQLTSTQPPGAPAQIGMTFKRKGGGYCRSFTVRRSLSLSGLACGEGGAWDVEAVAASKAATPGQPAGESEIPAAIRSAMEEQVVGDPLDPAAQAEARQNGWR